MYSWWPQACESCEFILTCHIFAIIDLKIPGSYDEPTEKVPQKKRLVQDNNIVSGVRRLVSSPNMDSVSLFLTAMNE